MATIIIQGEYCKATLTEPDDEGDVGYVAECGATSEDWGNQPIGDMIEAAGNHVDSPWTPANPDIHRERVIQ